MIKDLLEVLGMTEQDEIKNGYCVTSVQFKRLGDPGLYWWDWEGNRAEPKLKELGYKVIRWYTGDGDSFGPLTRVVVVEKNGVKEEFFYG